MTGTGAGVGLGGGEAMATIVGVGVSAGVGSGADDEEATAWVSKGTDLARLDIRGWALDATDPDLRIEIRRRAHIAETGLRFRF
jgi:hypothetical protein